MHVGCPCDEWIPVFKEQAGKAVTCKCGRRVEVPLWEEFDWQEEVLSSATVETRISRLLAARELPRIGKCEMCGTAEPHEVVSTMLDCEQSNSYLTGGSRYLWIPGVAWVRWEEEKRIETIGRDTLIYAPICLCKKCQADLRVPADWPYVLAAVAVVILTVAGIVVGVPVIGWIALLICVALGLMAMGVIGFQRWSALAQRRDTLIGVIGKVPVYRQILDRFPDAVIRLHP